MSRSAEAVPVPRARLAEVWPVVEPLLTPALSRGGEMTTQTLAEALRDGRFLLWLAWSGRLEAVAVTEIADTIAGRVCCIVACGGRERARWLGLRTDLETYARRAGCTRMRIYGRKGWLRALPDYRPVRVILEKDL
jgi:hypothetical protein